MKQIFSQHPYSGADLTAHASFPQISELDLNPVSLDDEEKGSHCPRCPHAPVHLAWIFMNRNTPNVTDRKQAAGVAFTLLRYSSLT